MSAVFCTLCRTNAHPTRECKKIICHYCKGPGHQLRDCPERRKAGRMAIHFKHDATVGAAVTPRSMRNMPNLGMFLRTLPEMVDTVQGRNQFHSNGNRLNIDYGQADEIMISLQNGVDNNETLIQITPTRIKVSAKYSVLNGELYEDSSRDAFGNNHDIVPQAAAYVLLIDGDMWNSTVCFQLDRVKYFLEWQPVAGRPAVVMSSTYMYNFRREQPATIGNLREYFEGRIVPPPIAVAIDANNQEDEMNHDNNVSPDEDGAYGIVEVDEARAPTAIADEVLIPEEIISVEPPGIEENINNDHVIDEEIVVEAVTGMSPNPQQFVDRQFSLEEPAILDPTDDRSDDEHQLVIDERDSTDDDTVRNQ